MGFSLSYTEFILPKPIVHALSLLCFIGKLTSSLFNHLGLSDFLETDTVWPQNPTRITSEPAILIRKMIPVMRYEELVDPQENCTVCLHEFEGGEEIRSLRNCKHVFHRACLDRWIDHDQKTCPLCRTPFFFYSDKNIREFS